MKTWLVDLYADGDEFPGREVEVRAKDASEAEAKALDLFPFYDTAAVRASRRFRRWTKA